MKQSKKIVPLFGLIAVFLLGITFPRIVGLIQDLNIQKGYEEAVVDAKTLQLAMNSNLTILEKMNVVCNTTSKVTLETAQKMDENEALNVLRTQIQEFSKESDLLWDVTSVDLDAYTEKKHLIQLGVYDQKSVIVWNFLLEDEKGNQLQVLLDDDSGKMLGITYATAKDPVENQESWGAAKNGTSNAYQDDSESDSSISRSQQENSSGTNKTSSAYDSDNILNKSKKNYKKLYGKDYLLQYGKDSEDMDEIASLLGEFYTSYLGQEPIGISLTEMSASASGGTYEYTVVMENSEDEEDRGEIMISLTDTQIRINM